MIRTVCLGVLVLTLALVGGGAALSGSPIVGVWSFQNGQIAIKQGPNGAFVGTVVSKTNFSSCTHDVGQQLWTGIKLQADGSYWGHHQWFTDYTTCNVNPVLGLAVWRFMKTASGSSYLSFCANEPGDASQPKIDSAGVSSGVTGGPSHCVSSASTGSVPVFSSAQFNTYVKFAGKANCAGPGPLVINATDPKNDPVKSVVVSLTGGTVKKTFQGKDLGAKTKATVTLKGVPKSGFTVKVTVTTVLGDHASGSRHYKLCQS